MVQYKVELVDLFYPIGSIYISTNNTNPSLLFGGNWKQIKDKFLLSCGDTYNNGATGGEATHTLTYDELPTHYHGFKSGVTWGWGDANKTEYANVDVYGSGSITGNKLTTNRTNGSTETLNAGNGVAHNNMPPYLAVYVWERIADEQEQQGE